jgi:hypothetical protein
MINSLEEAKEYCLKYGIVLSNHKTVIVTANRSIYLDTDNVDPADSPVRFVLKGTEKIEVKEQAEEPKAQGKKSKK